MAKNNKEKKKNPYKSTNKSMYFIIISLLVYLLLFFVVPIILSVIKSFQGKIDVSASIFKNTFTFDNYKNIFKSIKYEFSSISNKGPFLNTILIASISTFLSLILSLFVAIMLGKIKFLQNLYQTCLFLPYITNTIAIGMMFKVFFGLPNISNQTSQTMGLLNILITKCGFSPINFLGVGHSVWNMVVLILFIVWQSLPYNTLLIFSELQSINKVYYDAARIDGASKFTILRKITIPNISDTLITLFLTGLTLRFKEYKSVVALFGFAPGSNECNNNSMSTLMFPVINEHSKNYSSQSSAYAVFLTLIILFFYFISHLLLRKKGVKNEK